MNRPELSVLPVLEALQVLKTSLTPKMPSKIRHLNEKANDAELVAVAILQRVCVFLRHPATNGSSVASVHPARSPLPS